MSDIVPTPPEPQPLPFRRPADYYAAPPDDVRPIFPRWVPLGCGIVSLIAILALFGIGAVVGSGKAGSIFANLFATMASQIDGMFTKDVTAAQKAGFDAEMKTLRENLSQGKVSMDALQPLLKTIREASGDEHVTPDEALKLTKTAHEVNASAGKPRPVPR